MRGIVVVVVVALACLAGAAQASPLPEPELRLAGVSLNGEYVYRGGRYLRLGTVVDRSVNIAQADFFPPAEGVWLRSELVPLSALHTDVTVTTLEYTGGLAWRHWVVEVNAPVWYRWVVELGRRGESEPADSVTFYVRRRPRG